MIDEPLALLAEAFGQHAEPATPPLTEDDTSADPADLAIIAAASPGRAEAAQASCA